MAFFGLKAQRAFRFWGLRLRGFKQGLGLKAKPEPNPKPKTLNPKP